MKKINLNQILLLVIVILLAIFVLGRHSLNISISENNNNTISISGKAEKKVVPDRARISFSINEYRKSQKEAADIVNKKTKKIISALKDLGISEKDIKTKNYSVYPQYNWTNNRRVFENYRVSQGVEVIIKDLDKVSKVLATAVDLKVDNLNGPNMFIDDIAGIKDELRAEAIANAKAKAKELAKELGVSIDRIVSFTENNNDYYPQPVYSRVFMADAVAKSEAITEPEINPGEEKISKSVTITFQIED